MIFKKHFMPENNKITKSPESRIDILRLMARNGNRTVGDLEVDSGKKQSNISNHIKWLSENKLVEKGPKPSGYKNKVKNATQFYSLTIEGLKVAIDDPLGIIEDETLSSEDAETLKRISENKRGLKPITNYQFWKYLVDNHQESDLKLINGLMDFFLDRIYKTHRRYIMSDMFESFPGTVDIDFYKHTLTPWNEKYAKPILYLISTTTKQLTEKQIETKLQKIHGKDYYTSNIDSLYSMGFLTKNDGKYELTVLGLIELLCYRYIYAEKLSWNSKQYISYQEVYESKKPLAKKTKKIFEDIRIKYSYLLSEIFSGGNYEKSGISFYEVTTILLRLYKKLPDPEIGSNGERDNQYLEEFQALQGFNKTRSDYYHRKLTEFLDIGDEIITEIFDDALEHEKNNVTAVYAIMYLFTLPKKEAEKPLKDLEYFERYHKAQLSNIKDRITFDFYSLYKAYCNGWNTCDLGKSETRKWHDAQTRELLSFSKKYNSDMDNSLTQQYISKGLKNSVN